MERNRKEAIRPGDRFGRLVAIGEQFRAYTNSSTKVSFVVCKCDCGKIVVPMAGNLRHKRSQTKSCGCLGAEQTSNRNRTHGQSRTALYRRWHDMWRRCENTKNKQYKDYGGRGISVCAEWGVFERFRDWAIASGFSENLELDRIDVNGNYCPENCRFVTKAVNQSNKRDSLRAVAWGETKTISQWIQDDRCVVSRHRILARVLRGWSVESAMSTPVPECGRDYN